MNLSKIDEMETRLCEVLSRERPVVRAVVQESVPDMHLRLHVAGPSLRPRRERERDRDSSSQDAATLVSKRQHERQHAKRKRIEIIAHVF